MTKANCKNDLLTAIADPFLSGKTLKEALEASPPAKGISDSGWRTHLDYIIPRVDIHCKALHPYSLRRKRFQNYRKRDESLNAVCKSIVSLANVNAAQPLPALVAFGAQTGNSLQCARHADPRADDFPNLSSLQWSTTSQTWTDVVSQEEGHGRSRDPCHPSLPALQDRW